MQDAALFPGTGKKPIIPFNTGRMAPCPGCGAGTMVEVFPAMFRRTDGGGLGETVASSEEAACFYHPQKRAVVPCDGCGRFLCALCDVELNNQHLCPGCIQSGRRKGKLRNLENERVLYDRIALTVSIVPLLIWPFTVVSAPAALYFAIRHWKSPRSIVTGERACGSAWRCSSRWRRSVVGLPSLRAS